MSRLIAKNIGTHGQHVVCVGTSASDPEDFLPFAYTIGNHEAGLPELLFIGACDELHGRILNILGRVQRERRRAFDQGELVDFTAKYPALIREGGDCARTEYAVQVGVYYRTNRFDVRQVLFADEDGVYPGQPGCKPPWRDQRVLTIDH